MKVSPKLRDDYQDLSCYVCSASQPGSMTICKNTNSPARKDQYGRDGYAAYCTTERCRNTIQSYISEIVNFDDVLEYNFINWREDPFEVKS